MSEGAKENHIPSTPPEDALTTIENLKQENKKLQTLIQVNAIITSSLDRQDVLKSILKQTKLLMECSRSSILLVDDEEKYLYFEILSDDAEMKALSEIRLRRGEGVAGKVWSTEKPIIIHDANTDNRISKKADEKLKNVTETLIAAPLKVENQVIGVMEAMNKFNNKPFSEFDLHIFQTLCHQAALSIYNSRLYEMAIKDGMTGLFIKRYYFSRLEEEFSRSRRYKRDLALIMFDLDHFKRCNDTYGHPFGDKVLIKIAEIIKASCRSSDVPARYGGEEFSVIMPEADAKSALVVSERVLEEVEQAEFYHGETKVNITISAGISSLHEHNPECYRTLIDFADRALYMSKKNGRNQVTIFTPDH